MGSKRLIAAAFGALLIFAVSTACSGGDGDGTPKPTPTPFPTVSAPAGESPIAPLVITSPAFVEGATVPDAYTCEGENVSPGLSWTAGPATTRSTALLVDDPDAPGGTFTHWVLFDMPPSITGVDRAADTSTLGVTGKNGFGKHGYGGPCPPGGRPHRYRFTVYQLDTMLGLGDGTHRDDFLNAVAGHVVRQATLTGVFGR